ncbi:hypothetical protein EDB19DRAFT_1828492 [Suillus lakei]|nr:hypothetical protein EDB19DRAFT_1828492 [Suillus lakei]
MTQALSARTQQDREGAVEQTWRTHKGDDDTSASSSLVLGEKREADCRRNSNVLFEMTKTPLRGTRNTLRLWCWAGSKSRLREKLECEMATTPVHSIRKAPETPLHAKSTRNAWHLWCWARSEKQISGEKLESPETPRVSGVGREAKTDSERNLNVKWLRLQSIVLGKHVSGVGREAAADSKRIVGIDHCTALRPENERWITR